MKKTLGRVGLSLPFLPLLSVLTPPRAAADDLLEIHERKTLAVELTK